ncbi:MAG TPA: SdrD B-like domain-containing protein, partial [Humisphaera sp.]|nr:SdrD B-like domain-containing protein [Humisphaera sp.]
MSVVSHMKKYQGKSASSRRAALTSAVESLEVRQLFSGLLNLPLLPSPPSPSLGIDGGTASAVGPVGGTKEVTVNSPNNFTANLGGSPTLILPPFLVQIDVQVDSGGNLAGGNPHGGADLLVYQDINGNAVFDAGDTLLLQGNVANFGAGGLREEFVFTPTAGTLLPYFTLPAGIEPVGVQLDLLPTNPAITSLDFNNGFSGDQPKGLLGALPLPGGGPTIPKITTVPGGTVVIGSGVKLTDTATLSGGVNIASTDTITFNLYDPSNNLVDTETVPATANGNYTTPTGYLPTTVGTYQWVATFSGDANNNSVVSPLGDEPERVISRSPSINTVPVITTTTGSGGMFATIGFWHNQNGQAVIKNFDTGPSSTLLGNSLASHYPHLFGASNPYTGTSLAGLTNAQVAAVYLNMWTPSGLQKNTYVQAFAVALGSYASGGQGSFNVGNNGVAFGVSDGTILSITQILAVADGAFSPVTGLFFSGDSTKTSALNNVLNNINVAGEQPGGIPVVSIATINDTATLSGGFAETGTITFYLMGPGSTAATPLTNAVYTDVVTINGNGTYADATMGNNPGGYVPLVTGTYQWVAVYSGDGNNNGVISPFGSEPVVVGQQSPTVLKTTPNLTTVTLGTSKVKLTDAADLEMGNNPTGTLTWTLYLGNTLVDTETLAVNHGNGLYTTPTGYTLPTTGIVIGTYQWNLSYSGDANNVADTFNNDPTERTVVTPAKPGIVTTPSTTSCTQGSTLKDTAALSGGYFETGSITFTLVAPGGGTVDTETVTVAGNGSYSTPVGYVLPINAATGTYQWNAVFTDTDGNNLNANDQNNANERVTVNALPGSITGTIFCDNDLNNTYGSGDIVEPGAIVTLYNSANVAIATATSNSSGVFSFPNLAPGTYTLKLTTPSSGHTAELSHGAVVIASSITANVVSNGTVTGENFAEIDFGSISGLVFHDINDSGVFDSGDTGLPGAVVTLTGNDYLGHSVSTSITTGSNGTFSFTGLLPSSSAGYITTVTPPASFSNGSNSVGTLNGNTDGTGASNSGLISNIVLPGCNNDAIHYNFGELGVFHGLT